MLCITIQHLSITLSAKAQKGMTKPFQSSSTAGLQLWCLAENQGSLENTLELSQIQALDVGLSLLWMGCAWQFGMRTWCHLRACLNSICSVKGILCQVWLDFCGSSVSVLCHNIRTQPAPLGPILIN